MRRRFIRMDNPQRQLRAHVADFAMARQQAQAVYLAAWGVGIGGLIAGLVGAATQFFGFAGGEVVAIALGLSIIIAAAAVGWSRRTSETRIALEVDQRLDLRERVTTALEITTRQLDHPLADQQIADAVAHVAMVRRTAVYPIRLSPRLQVVVVAGIALAIIPLITPWDLLPVKRVTVSPVAITTTAQANRLDAAANQMVQQNTSTDQTTRSALASQLRQAAANLRQDGANTQRATNDLLSAEQAVSRTAPQTGESAAQTLARISDALNNFAATQAMTKALDQSNPAGAVAALSQQTKNLASTTPQQRANLANALQAASNAARGSDTSAAQELQQAAQAVRTGNGTQAQQAASQALQQLSTASQAQQDAQQALAQLESSRAAITQAAQTGQANPTSGATATSSSPNQQQSSGQNSQSQSGSQSQSTAAGQAQSGQAQSNGLGQTNANGQAGQGTSTSNQNSGGIGRGSTNHLGSTSNIPGLTQRQVVVPTNQQGDLGPISQSNQKEVGAGGEATVDYRNVLPQYQQQALQSIQGNAVPTDLKQVVKGYFDSLAP